MTSLNLILYCVPSSGLPLSNISNKPEISFSNTEDPNDPGALQNATRRFNLGNPPGLEAFKGQFYDQNCQLGSSRIQ